MNIADARNVTRTNRAEHIDAPPCQEQAPDTAKEREHKTFREKLTDDERPARSERSPDTDLTAPCRRPGEQKIGHVRARDQEHERNRA